MTAAAGADDRVIIRGRTYLVDGRIGVGERADVFRGRSDGPFPELVTIKIARSEDDAAALSREARFLEELGRSPLNGAYHFTRMLPQVVAHGESDGGLPATVFRRMNRYDWTLADVIREYPEGVEPEAAVWMWNRQLMLIGWVHRNRAAHGAIAPEHALIHPRNHGVRFVGWSSAGAFAGGLRPEEDIAATARTIVRVLGGVMPDGKMREAVPAPMADLLLQTADLADRRDAIALHDEFEKLAERLFGKRRYRPFLLPRPTAGNPE